LEDEKEELIAELLKCVRCGKCRAVCPELELEEFQEVSSPRGRARMAYGLLTGKIPPTQVLIDKIYSCFYCALCQETCPSGVLTSEIVLKTREELYKLGLAPENIKNLLELVLESKNIYGLDQEDRLEWAFDVEEIIEDKINVETDIGFFVGCTASYKGSLVSQPESVVKILDFLGINFTMLGENEMCCGNPYLLGGGSINEDIKKIVFNNIEKFEELKIKKLITACPGCYRVISRIYPTIYGKELPFEVNHVSQYFSDLIAKNELIFKNGKKRDLTFQDPCELTRHCGIYEPPRHIIKSIPGLQFHELNPSKEDALCCGGGGLVKAVFPELVDKHLKIKYDQISSTTDKAEGIITTCPSCQDNLEHGASILNKKFKVIGLCELIWDSINNKE
jgi:Fe-S oxidoreductase